MPEITINTENKRLTITADLTLATEDQFKELIYLLIHAADLIGWSMEEETPEYDS